MSEEAQLIAAVLAAPDDDGPRLVLADYWTTKGDPRGEFTTLQCRMAAAKNDEDRRKIRIAENKLLAAHGLEWSKAFLAAAPPGAPLRANKIEFHRGFLEEAALPIQALDDLEPFFEAAPLLRRVRIDMNTLTAVPPHAPPSLTGKLNSPRLRGVRSLDFRIPAGGDLAALAIAESSQLKGLRELKLEATAWAVEGYPAVWAGDPATHKLTAAGARALAGAFPALKKLELNLNALGSAGVVALCEGQWKLEHLDVSMNQLDDAALVALASATSMGNLKWLSVGAGTYTEKGLAALASSKTLGSLETLELNGSPLGPKSFEAFLKALKLPKLRELSAGACGLLDQGVAALCKAKVAGQFESLALQDNKVTQAGLAALASSPHLGGLKRLLLNDAWLGKKANVEILAGAPTLAECKVYVKGTLISGKAKKEAKEPKPDKKKRAAPKKKK